MTYKINKELKNLPDPSDIKDACLKNYVDNILKNDIDINSNNLTNINSITLNEQAETDNEVITKAYVDQFHQQNERSRRDLGIYFYDESTDLVRNSQNNDLNDKKLTNIDSITVKREATLDNDLSSKKHIDDELAKNTVVRFNQTLQNYLKVTVGNDVYNLTKYDKIKLTDTTVMKAGNTGGYLVQKWNIKCKDKSNTGKIQKFIKNKQKKTVHLATVEQRVYHRQVIVLCI